MGGEGQCTEQPSNGSLPSCPPPADQRPGGSRQIKQAHSSRLQPTTSCQLTNRQLAQGE